jgi:hypothetical protein
MASTVNLITLLFISGESTSRTNMDAYGDGEGSCNNYALIDLWILVMVVFLKEKHLEPSPRVWNILSSQIVGCSVGIYRSFGSLGFGWLRRLSINRWMVNVETMRFKCCFHGVVTVLHSICFIVYAKNWSAYVTGGCSVFRLSLTTVWF